MGFRLANVAGRAALVDGDGYHDLEAASDGSFTSDPMEAVRRFSELHAVAEGLGSRTSDGLVADAELGPPVPRPVNVFAVGLNYQAHADEGSMEVPESPLIFTKWPTCLVGPDADVELNSEAGDYEAELVVVIGEGGRDIAEADAWEHVMGVMVGQDISDRALQFAAKPPHFDLGKSRDTYGPTGPWLTSTDLAAAEGGLAIRCEVNGETRQDASTADLIFDVPTLITYLSSILTLQTGDLIFTGTPEGVGAGTLTFLQPGDVIETEIAGLGTLRNRCT